MSDADWDPHRITHVRMWFFEVNILKIIRFVKDWMNKRKEKGHVKKN